MEIEHTGNGLRKCSSEFEMHGWNTSWRMAVDLMLLCMFLEDVTDFLKPDTANCTSTVCNRTIWASIVLAVNHLQAFFCLKGKHKQSFPMTNNQPQCVSDGYTHKTKDRLLFRCYVFKGFWI